MVGNWQQQTFRKLNTVRKISNFYITCGSKKSYQKLVNTEKSITACRIQLKQYLEIKKAGITTAPLWMVMRLEALFILKWHQALPHWLSKSEKSQNSGSWTIFSIGHPLRGAELSANQYLRSILGPFAYDSFAYCNTLHKRNCLTFIEY